MAVSASFDGAAFRRFPLAIAMQTVATVLVVGMANGWLAGVDETDWTRAIAGLATGALFALAGNLFTESRPERRAEGLVLAYVVPLVVAAAFQIRDTTNFSPYLLPAVGVLWASVAAFTGQPAESIELQNRFWWLNQRALAGLVLAASGLAVLALGCFVIQQSILMLFNVDLSDALRKGVLPIAGFLLAPVYWLSTLPRPSDYEARDLFEPDFMTRAVGFIGQFVLAPILVIYAAILLVYAVEIAASRSLPHGTLGWMVLGFTVAGAATWMLLYPPFMSERLVVRIFRRSWFSLTIVPLVLLGIAIAVRVIAYGLSSDRMLLIGGGVWALVLTVLFLLRRGDIRQIPTIAAIILALLCVGPWNVENGPRVDQARRLDSVITDAGGGSHPSWSPDQLAIARSAIDALIATPPGRTALAEVLAAHDIAYDRAASDTARLIASFPGAATAVASPAGAAAAGPKTSVHLQRPSDSPLDIAQTPLYVGPLTIWRGQSASLAGLDFALDNQNELQVTNAAGQLATLDVSPWAVGREVANFAKPGLDFDLDGRHYRLVADNLDLLGTETGPQSVTRITGVLFTAPPKPAPVRPPTVPADSQKSAKSPAAKSTP